MSTRRSPSAFASFSSSRSCSSYLENAYLVYILGCSARDERAIAKVRELRANNNVSAHFFVALGTAYAGGILEEEKVRGNETLEDLRELYLMFEPPGNHP